MGDQLESEFIELINQNLGIAHKVGRIYFPDDEREDVLQEMMYQLWRSYPRFDGRSKFSTWMYRVCLNTAFTYKRKNKAKKNESLSLVHEHIADHPGNPGDENQEAAITLLLGAIEGLSSLNKAIVLLYMENMSYEEIASVMGLSRSNVSVRLVRIKKELETQLRQKIKAINDVNT
jgi:RNA polymerase sigma factor (sigma-70 family)